MKRVLSLFFVIIFILGLIVLLSYLNRPTMQSPALTTKTTNSHSNMFLASPNFESGESIPPKFTCDGDDISPALIIKDVPPQAKSLALIVDDPDAPMGTWLHWTVWNIDPAVSFIPEGTVPRGAVEGVTDFGKVGYGGPCPPSGTHRYFFKLYALDNKLNLPSGASLSDIKESIEGHILAEAQFVGTYGRE